MARRVRKTQHLVSGYLEQVSSKVFSGFPKQLTQLVGRQHGVYALYKGSHLYYVGLATNLRTRINHHLRDKHAGKWDRFSLYLVRKADHIKELESLVMRIAAPRGNASTGRLPHASNLRSQLLTKMKKAQEEQLDTVLGGRDGLVRRVRRISLAAPVEDGARQPTLGPYVQRRFTIRATHKGTTYRARVRRTGCIYFLRHRYNSPSWAGKAAIGRPVNGWDFWKYKDASGAWVPLSQLRRNPR